MAARATEGRHRRRRLRRARSRQGAARAPVDVTLIDRQNHHCFQPLLYQVATAALSPAEIAWPIRHILRRQQNATVLMAEVTGVDTAGRLLETAAGPMPYDYLVIATGATHSYFGHDEWAAFAPGLKRIEDATRIRRSILLRLRAGRTHARRGRAAAPAHLRHRRRRRDRRRNGRRHRRDRAPDAGQGFPPHRSAHGAHHPDRSRAARAADVAGAICRTMCARALTRDGRRGADLDARDELRRRAVSTSTWSHRRRHHHLGCRRGGVAGRALARRRARPRRAGDRRPDLSVPGHPDIFVIGDTAARARRQAGNRCPASRRRQSRWEHYVGKLIAARIAGGRCRPSVTATSANWRPSAGAPRW